MLRTYPLNVDINVYVLLICGMCLETIVISLRTIHDSLLIFVNLLLFAIAFVIELRIYAILVFGLIFSNCFIAPITIFLSDSFASGLIISFSVQFI